MATTSLIPQISNIEVYSSNERNIADDGIADDDILTIALSSLTGIESLANIAGGDGVTFNDVGNVVSLKAQSAINTTTVNYDAAALAGAADAITITVSGTNSTTIAITDDSAATTSVLLKLLIL